MEYCYNENYFCDICDCDFTKNSEYLVHSIHKHGITEDEISYDCANCFQSFTLLSNFQQHIVKNNERLKTTKIQLDNAEIVFTKEKAKKSDDSDIEYDLYNEDESKDADKHYKCDLCENTFFNNSFLLESHLSKVHGTKRVASKIEMPKIATTKRPKECISMFKRQCNHCGKSFSQAGNLKKHIHSVHEGHKDYKCDSCGKSFTISRSLEYHLHTVHDGYKDYKCESCDKSFSRAQYLRRHILKVHEGNIEK